MKIRINNSLSLEQYMDSTDLMSDDIKVSIETMYIIGYNEMDYIANESIVGDMVKTTYRGTKGAVKLGVKGVQAAGRGYNQIKNNWNSKIKPQIIKLLKNFAISLQNLWAKFMRYDKQYKELGGKINNIIQFSINQMQYMPDVTLYYHNFNAEFLKGLVDLVSNWAVFEEIVTTGYKGRKSGVFTGAKVPTPLAIADAIKRNNINELKSLVSDFSNGIGRLNSHGDLTIGLILDNIFKWGIVNNLPDELRDKANKNQLGLADYIKHAILGEVTQKHYNDENKDEFKQDMTGRNGSYLRLVASILNNDILADALKKGGASTKKGTDLLIKNMETVMKQAEIADKLEQDRAAQRDKQNNTSNTNVANANLANNTANPIEQSTQNTINNSQNFGTNQNRQTIEEQGIGNSSTGNEPEDTLSGLTDLYCKNYIVFVTKLSNTYGNIVRGMLAATYEIISEAGGIISTIEAGANKVK